MPSGELLRTLLAVAPDEARSRADEILDAPEYAPPEPTVFDSIGEWFNGLIQSIGEGSANVVVATIVVGLLLALIAFLVYRSMRESGRVGRIGDPDAVTVAVEERRAVAEWLDLATEHEAAGRWREALRCRYRALVGRLIDRGLLRDVPGRTAGEFRRELSGSAPDIAGAFADASDLFERAWYGNLPTGPEESARFAADADRTEPT